MGRTHSEQDLHVRKWAIELAILEKDIRRRTRIQGLDIRSSVAEI